MDVDAPTQTLPPPPASIPVPTAPAATAAAPTPQDLRQKWAAQLAVLADMGITDMEVAIQNLEATGGNIDLALQLMFG